MSSHGIIYGLTGPSHAELFVVSIWTLRQHYDGPVTLFLTPDCREVGEWIATDKRLGIKTARTNRLDGEIVRAEVLGDASSVPTPTVDVYLRVPRPHWTQKAVLYLQSPYDYTVYLDGDTLVLESPDHLFNSEAGLVFAVTRCDGEELRLLSDHPYPRSLIKQIMPMDRYGPVFAEMCKQARRRNGFAANNGVLAFRKQHPALWEIHHLAVGFRRERLHDELATQLVLPRYQQDIRYVGGRWNCLAKYEDNWRNAAILHLHNSAHLRRWKGDGAANARAQWLKYFRQAWEADAGGLQRWGGTKAGDPELKGQIEAWKLSAAV